MPNKLAVFLILLAMFAAIFSSATYYVLSPKASQSFMSFGVYSQKGLEQYVPTSNSTVYPGNTTSWTLAVTNTMGTSQLVMIRVRIGNNESVSVCVASACSPNATTYATWFPQVSSIEQFVDDGATSRIEFTWTLEPGSNQTRLNLQVNGASINTAPIGAVPGQSLRWIFELWTFDASCGDPLSSTCFYYGFGPKASPIGTWLQVWFNIAP